MAARAGEEDGGFADTAGGAIGAGVGGDEEVAGGAGVHFLYKTKRGRGCRQDKEGKRM